MSGNESPQNDYQTLLAEISARYMAANIPIRAQVEVTKRCHLNCRHCYVDHLETKRELKTSEILSIFDQLEELGTLFLTLTGGEFFLRKDAWTILEQARDRQFFIKLYTTGTLLGPEDIRRLDRMGIGEVHVSVYSHRPEIHDDITMKPGSHAKSLEAIRAMRAVGLAVVVKTPILTLNKDDILETVRMAKSMGCDYMLSTEIVQAENQARDPQKYLLSQSEMDTLITDPRLAPIFYKGGSQEEFCRHVVDHDKKGVVCGIGQQMLLIDAVGDVHPCALYPAIANIREHRLADIWRENPEMNRLRGIRFETQTDCPSCELLPYCKPCPASALLETGDDRGCCRTARLQAGALRKLEETSTTKNGGE